MAYVKDVNVNASFVRLGSVIALHAALIAALLLGSKAPVFQDLPPPIDFSLIKETKAPPKVELPPVVKTLPPVFVPRPEINIPYAGGETTISYTNDNAVPPRAVGQGNRQPEYPISARRLKQQGTVIMLLLVGLDGRVSDAKVETSSGFAALDEAATREALRSWRYTPGSQAGVAQPMWVRAQVRFRCGVNGCG